MANEIHGNDASRTYIAGSMRCLASSLRCQGKLEDAEDFCRKSLDMELTLHGAAASHPDIATSQDELGKVFQARGKLLEAQGMYESHWKWGGLSMAKTRLILIPRSHCAALFIIPNTRGFWKGAGDVKKIAGYAIRNRFHHGSMVK